MKKSIGILVGLLALLVVSITVQAVSCIEVETAIGFVKQNIWAVAPVAIVSSNITQELINDLKIKFGSIKIITVTVEPDVYDIDELTAKDKANLRRLGIDVSIICNSDLDLADRLAPYEKFKEELKNANPMDLDKKKIFDELPLLEGAVIYAAEKYQFLVKRPDKGLIKMLLPLAEKGKIDEFAEKAIKNLVVDGDMQALEDGIVFMGVVSQLRQLIQPAQSFLSRA